MKREASFVKRVAWEDGANSVWQERRAYGLWLVAKKQELIANDL